MVDDISFGDINKLAMHQDSGIFSIRQTDGTFGIDYLLAFCPADAPFVFGKRLIVTRIDNGIFALSQGDFPESVAVSQPPV